MYPTSVFVRLYVLLASVLSNLFSTHGARVRGFNAHVSKHSEEEPPPLEGCEDNFWDKQCCCFVDFGILKQEYCSCTSGAKACQGESQIEYSQTPSRPIEANSSGTTPAEWKAPAGFIRGYQAVAPEFCKAPPVRGPQIDSYERSYECACSNSMSQTYEMQCGSSCNVQNCKRWNPIKTDWEPFDEGRGKCCLSSFATSTGGCVDTFEPITESHASVILRDAMQHAMVDQTYAFVPTTSEPLMQEMTKSFATAREKKMSTSRSGAQFFFSGDYKYILKSIHTPEYNVLKKITLALPGSKTSLDDHIRKASEAMKDLSSTDFCEVFRIEMAQKFHKKLDDEALLDNARRLTGMITGAFFGQWFYDAEGSRRTGVSNFAHVAGGFRAYWCPEAAEWRISDMPVGKDLLVGSLEGCSTHSNDPLYRWLYSMRGEVGASMMDVRDAYTEFMSAFHHGKTSKQVEKPLTFIVVKCDKKWQPAPLINEFALAFKYRSSAWMVVKNSVATIKDKLAHAGITKFYKEYDLFDVKPFPIASDEREPLFKMNFLKDGLAHWRNWDSVETNLRNDVAFMDNVLDDPMVDYSLLVSVFYINNDSMVLAALNLPNCVEQQLSNVRTISSGSQGDYGDTRGSILVCFSIIDILMEFTLSKKPENALLFNKWSDWSAKMEQMLSCLGTPRKKGCEKYAELHSKFHGVDIPDIPTALVQDVTRFFNADGELMRYMPSRPLFARHGFTRDYQMLKCCCKASMHRCVLKDASGLSTSWLSGNPRGCGALVGSGWHSYWREAGRCRVSLQEASKIRGISFKLL